MERLRQARGFARLLRWLGPWTEPTAVPRRVTRRELTIPRAGGAPLRVYGYLPDDAPPLGCYLIAHGLAPWGPDDPRLDRFMRVLARAGFAVYAPFLPDFVELRFAARVSDDFERAYEALLEWPERPAERRIGVFSISFGCFPALSLLARRSDDARLSGAVVFGGYADPLATLQYVQGRLPQGFEGPASDPLSAPALALNLLDELGVDPALQPALRAALLRYIQRTWGHPELKARDRHVPIARELAAELDTTTQPVFLSCCGLTADSRDALGRALDRCSWLPELDLRPALPSVRHPVCLIHGKDDDVIPHSELAALAGELSHARAYLTGLYDHTSTRHSVAWLRTLPDLGHDGATLLAMLGAIMRVGSRSV